jgi:hypothetical protein
MKCEHLESDNEIREGLELFCVKFKKIDSKAPNLWMFLEKKITISRK